MSVGIMDADLAAYHVLPFNIQAMKISEYYKKKREIVVLARDFTPERNKLFYYCKDWDDGAYPPELLTTPNVKYCGHAFTGTQYIALPEDIEMCHADTSLYACMEKDMTGRGKFSKKVFQNMMKCEHIQLSLDGANLWDKWSKQLRDIHTTQNVMFHDYDLNAIEGSWDAVKEIMSMTRHDGWAPRVGMKWPVQVNNKEDLMHWSSLRPNSTFYSLSYNGVMDVDTMWAWAGQCFEKSVYTQMDYNITKVPYFQQDFVSRDMLNIYMQVVISRSYRAKISLKYEDAFFPNPMWRKTIDLMNYYQHSMQGISEVSYLTKISNDTMYDFVCKSLNGEACYKRYAHAMPREEMRQVFWFVKEHHPELFDAFYNLNFQQLRGGKYDEIRYKE